MYSISNIVPWFLRNHEVFRVYFCFKIRAQVPSLRISRFLQNRKRFNPISLDLETKLNEVDDRYLTTLNPLLSRYFYINREEK